MNHAGDDVPLPVTRASFLVAAVAVLLASCQTPGGPSGGPSPSPPPACAPGQYVNEGFPGATVTGGVLYSSVVDAFGVHNLRMDIYQPQGDTARSRPALVWVFGGNFQTGSRAQLADYATEFARRGYVTAAIDYRLLKAYEPHAPLAMALEVAQSDAQAAIRYLRVHAAQLGIDPGRIAIGGWSAGSLTAFAVGYNYEFTGDNTDNSGPSQSVAVVLGLDGFLTTPAEMRANDPPFILFRGALSKDDDNPLALPALIAQAQALAIPYEVDVVPGAAHTELIRRPFIQTISAQAAPFLHRFFCQ